MDKNSQPLRVLIIEDNATDSELMVRELRRAGFEPDWQRVDTEADFSASLDPKIDIILSDYAMPQFSGLRALELLKESGLEIPFVLVSGTIGEETAVEAMRSGTTDYLLKDRLTRLGQAVEHALGEKRIRDEVKQAQARLKLQEQQYRLLFETNPNPMWVFATETLQILAVNEAAIVQYGYSRDEFLKLKVKDLRPLEDVPDLLKVRALSSPQQMSHYSGQFRHIRKDRSLILVEIYSGPIVWEGVASRIVTAIDVTGRKRAEEEAKLLQAIALEAGETEDLDSALGVVLRNVCEKTGWSLGQAWIPRLGERVLECSAAWWKDRAGMETFRAVSQGFTFLPGVGLPGRVWASKQPAWIRDVTIDTNFPREQAAREVHLKAAVAIPVMAVEEVVAVVEFFVRESREEDERFVKLISSVVAQLGQIIQRKRLEESLRVSEERFRSLVQSANDAIVLADDRGKIVSWNRGAQVIFGYSEEEVLGKPLTTLMPERYRDAHGKGLARFHATGENRVIGKTVELHGLKKDGSEFPLELSLAAWRTGAGTFFSGIIRDITKRKQAEEALRRAEEKYRTIFENAAEGIFQTTPEGRYISVNPAFARMCGYGSPEELTASVGDIGRIVYVDPERRTEFKRLIEAQGFVERFECEVYRKDGRKIWLSENARAVRDANGAVIYYEGTVQDITERRRAEERLGEQADIINRAQDAVIIRNFENDRITFWNSGAERLYGWSATEAIGRTMGELILAASNEREALVERLISTGEFHGEIKHHTKDGREIIVDSRATLIRNDDSTPRSVLGINTDITEKKELEAQLLRAQRLESIGTLASGVAHDLNNILTPILMSAQTLRDDLTDEDRQSALSLIEESARRGAGIVKQVLTFARGIEGERVTINPRHLIDEMVDIARKTFPKSIEISGRYPEELWSIQGDPTQLHQVLLNLSVNARDAMPKGGSLALVAENLRVDEGYAAMIPGAKIGPYVMLRVSDTGAGMPRDTIDKIFDPFFTTKEVGKGTGLGLSTALGIVKSHGGFISVYSEIGRGTTFKLFLPAAMTREELQESKASVVPIQGNGELILVVDDEPNILGITKMILEKHNYGVLSANDGPEALAIFAQQMQSIRAVLTDISMPYMDGATLARALIKMKSDLPVIASTGQDEQMGVAEFQGLGVKHFLTKPYNAQQLLATVHDTLQEKAEPAV